MLDGNADVNAKSVEGYTPLMYAANTGRTALAKFLLKHPKIKIHEQVWMSKKRERERETEIERGVCVGGGRVLF